MHVERLTTPIEVEMGEVPVTCTHTASGMTIQPWNDPGITTYSVYGIMRGARFVPVTQPEYTSIGGADFEELEAMGDSVTLADIKAKASEINARGTSTHGEAVEGKATRRSTKKGAVRATKKAVKKAAPKRVTKRSRK